MSTRRSTALWCALCVMGTACEPWIGALGGPLHGPEIPLGDGRARTFLELDDHGQPVEMGVEFGTRFDALPNGAMAYRLEMPPETPAIVPVDHVVLRWRPGGHEPELAYGLPHVDVRFFLLDDDGRDEVAEGDCEGTPLTCEALERARRPLADVAHPPGHAALGLFEPGEGAVLFDLFAPEVMGSLFELGWTYGRFDGRVSSFGAEASRGWLETLTDETCIDVTTPRAFPRAGWYPTTACGSWGGDGNYRVTLRDFQRFTSAGAL